MAFMQTDTTGKIHYAAFSRYCGNRGMMSTALAIYLIEIEEILIINSQLHAIKSSDQI